MSLAGIFTAVIFVMAAVPFLGYIPLGFMNATIIHVPVIIGALILGPRYGAWLGFVFGMTSLIRATLTPTVTSFVFSPFITIGGYRGNLWSIVIAVVPGSVSGSRLIMLTIWQKDFLERSGEEKRFLFGSLGSQAP